MKSDVCNNGVNFEELCLDIINRSNVKKRQIDDLIFDLKKVIKTPNDILTFLPNIKELLEVSVKNDDQLVKLAAIIQRMQSNTNIESELLTEEEKEELQKNSNIFLHDINAKINDILPSNKALNLTT